MRPSATHSRRTKARRAELLGLAVLVTLALSACGTAEKTTVDTRAPTSSPETGLTAGQERVQHWHDLIRRMRSEPTLDKLISVNEFFNRLEFVDDLEHWGKQDYWATPTEMLLSNGGDCEDFTIAKYFTLKELQIPESQMRLTYVKSLTLNQPHMVLAYYPRPNGEPMLLDNLMDFILPASDRHDLVPVYSFNGEGLWLAKQRGEGELVGDSDRLSRWRDLLRRMDREQAPP